MFSIRKRQPHVTTGGNGVTPGAGSPDVALLEATLDKILDTLNAVVRMLGRHSFDTSERNAAQFREDCERWSRHILIGTNKPDAAQTDADNPDEASHQQAAQTVPLAKRDWNGLYHFLQQQRASEEQAVIGATGALRNLVFDSLNSFRQVLEEDKKFSGDLGVALERLEQSSQNQPIEVMRAQILQTAQSISGMLKAKSRSVDEQFERMRAQIQATRQEMLDMRRELEEDSLTGIYNRRALDHALIKIANYVSFVREDLAVILIDVDNFKEVNQVNGNEAGDALLRGVGQTLIKAFPRRDDLIARFGGDEFAVILTRTDEPTASRLANRCVNLFRELEIPWDEDLLSCTVSVGVANYDFHEDITNCLARAEAALQRAKHAGRNRFAAAVPPSSAAS